MAQFISIVFNEYIMSRIVKYITNVSVFLHDDEITNSDEMSDTDQKRDTDEMERFMFVYATTYILESISKYIIDIKNTGVTGVNIEVNGGIEVNIAVPTGVNSGVNIDNDPSEEFKSDRNFQPIDGFSNVFEITVNDKEDKLINVDNYDNHNDSNNYNDKNNDNNSNDDDSDNCNENGEIQEHPSNDLKILLLSFLPLYSINYVFLILLDSIDMKLKNRILDIIHSNVFDLLSINNGVFFDSMKNSDRDNDNDNDCNRDCKNSNDNFSNNNGYDNDIDKNRNDNKYDQNNNLKFRGNSSSHTERPINLKINNFIYIVGNRDIRR